jgi:tetratricopeptide (TPR) repeat protein
MADYDHAIQAEPNRAARWDARAAEREYQGDLTGALADMDEAIRVEPSNADMREGRAWVLLDMGRTDEALVGFADAIRIDPKAGGRLSSRGYALAQIGRFDESLADYNRAEQLEPTQGVFLAQRMSVYLLQGQPLSALPDIDRSMVVEPGYADGLYLRGFTRLAALQPDDAIRDFTAYLAQRPEGRLGFNGRAFAKMMKGDFAGAAADFRKSVDLNLLDTAPILWLHVANERLGKDDREELAKYALRVDPKGWPGPALRFALGQLSLEAMLAAADSPSELTAREHQADAYYYAGEYYLSIHDTANAQKMFLEAISRNQRDKIEDVAARGELAALNK